MDDDTLNEEALKLQAWVRERIETLRPRLLDLTRRNPLLSTRLNSYVRVVDELPDVLAFELNNNNSMYFDPLPTLDSDPKDEGTIAFRSAFAEAQRTDEQYLESLEEILSGGTEAEELARQLDRQLKDKVRESLGMPPREISGEISLEKHAELHDISPKYDLPLPDDEHNDGRHRDDAIQTLLLPDQLERKLNSLITKCNTWIQETGINVLHAAYGFLEWQDKPGSKSCFAPLVLMPAAFTKKKTPSGPVFWVEGRGESCETNLILAEFLKREFDLELPPYEDGSIEEYYEEVSQLKPQNLKKFVVRRQVVFGVFPSARLAMYHDLDPSKHPIHKSEIVCQLLGGLEPNSGASPFADERDVEAPEIEAKVPCIVTEADSSQLSVLVDLAEGSSIAVEGPPGTGKSQTIVNAIAAAMADGKKVLFVAEKMAALEVVKARLEALDLGDFLLPLQAERSSREQVISSLKSRLEMTKLRAPREYDEKLDEFRRLRSNINTYVETVSKAFGETGMSVYEVLGKAIKTHEVLQDRSDEFVNPPIVAPDQISRVELQQAIDAAKLIDELVEELSGLPDYWSQCAPERADKIELDQIRFLAKDAAQKCQEAAVCRDGLSSWNMSTNVDTEELNQASKILELIVGKQEIFDSGIFGQICTFENRASLQEFVSGCEKYQRTQKKLSEDLVDPYELGTSAKVAELKELVTKNDFESLDTGALRNQIQARSSELINLESNAVALAPLHDDVEQIETFPLETLRQAELIVAKTRREVLALRNPSLDTPEIAAVIRGAANDARALREARESIETRMAIPRDIPTSQLLSCASDIENAGLLSFFSSDVRFAKRTLKGLCKTKPPKGRRAGLALRAIAKFKEDQQAFVDNPAYRNVFGFHFAGLDTDFQSFESLLDFYDEVETSLRGASNRDCRKLLKEGRIETLFELPELCHVTWNGVIGDLGNFIQSEQAALIDAENAVSRIETLSEIFKYPSDLTADRLGELDVLARDSVHAKQMAEENKSAGTVFHKIYRGAATNVGIARFHLLTLDVTKKLPRNARALQSVLSSGEWSQLLKHIRHVLSADEKSAESVGVLSQRSGKEFAPLIARCDFAAATQYLKSAAEDENGLSAHVRLSQAFKNLFQLGFDWVPLSITTDLKNSTVTLAELIKASVYRCMSSIIMDVHGGSLNRYQGRELNQMRAKLSDLDKQMQLLSRQKLRALASSKANPPIGIGSGPKKGWTELSLIENETAKQRRFISVRDLTKRAGRALQQLKPCWMMSPLAVAQYLPAQEIRFDLCIIDEASQMKPEDALGALARCDQVMIVGDVNQLPPSNFFNKMLADDEDEEGASVEEESILEIANAQLRPNRRLRWHYRSQHSNLIRFSNELIYDSSLVIFPSSDEERSDRGVSLKSVNGLYSKSVNPIEAKAIVEAAIGFMRGRPNESLGIVTLNQKQRDLLIDEMNLAVEQNEFASQYIDKWDQVDEGLERFFIKNLENVQGDERDVIFIGTVYGPEREGAKPMQRFGPINGISGKRRLNVLFTRAKKQIVTFSSLRPSDITATETSNPGTYMLKRWLEYSATNILAKTEGVHPETDSEFEDYVIEQIRAMGCEAVPQVGDAGYRIDIGVRHPDWPYGYMLAVECDGATYHSSRSARDRDRLRQEVLERLGWSFHRIWSTDWFNDPRAETQKLRERIADRLSELKEQEAERAPLWERPRLVELEPASTRENIQSEFSELGVEREQDSNMRNGLPSRDASYIEVGDTVRVTYLSGSKASLQVTISDSVNNPENGIISVGVPLAEALLGAEQGEEIEVLDGSYVRKAVVEEVRKAVAA